MTTEESSPPTTTPLRSAVIRQAISVSVATALYGISFGALAVAAGLTIAQAMVLSLLLFSGGSQFAVIGIIGAGGGPASAVSTAGLLGARNALYGAQLGPLLALRSWRRLAAIHLTIDESTAVSTAQPDRELSRTGFWWTGIGVFAGWNAMTLVGTIAGQALGEPRQWGLDAAASAAFLGLLWPRLASPLLRLTAGCAVVIAIALTPVVPAGIPVLAAAMAAVIIGSVDARRRPVATPAGDTSPAESESALRREKQPEGGPP